MVTADQLNISVWQDYLFPLFLCGRTSLRGSPPLPSPRRQRLVPASQLWLRIPNPSCLVHGSGGYGADVGGRKKGAREEGRTRGMICGRVKEGEKPREKWRVRRRCEQTGRQRHERTAGTDGVWRIQGRCCAGERGAAPLRKNSRDRFSAVTAAGYIRRRSTQRDPPVAEGGYVAFGRRFQINGMNPRGRDVKHTRTTIDLLLNMGRLKARAGSQMPSRGYRSSH